MFGEVYGWNFPSWHFNLQIFGFNLGSTCWISSCWAGKSFGLVGYTCNIPPIYTPFIAHIGCMGNHGNGMFFFRDLPSNSSIHVGKYTIYIHGMGLSPVFSLMWHWSHPQASHGSSRSHLAKTSHVPWGRGSEIWGLQSCCEFGWNCWFSDGWQVGKESVWSRIKADFFLGDLCRSFFFFSSIADAKHAGKKTRERCRPCSDLCGSTFMSLLSKWVFWVRLSFPLDHPLTIPHTIHVWHIDLDIPQKSSNINQM